MQVVVWIVLAVVIAFVVFDARAREGEPTPRPRDTDQTLISTQKIIVDLTKRR